MSAALHLAKPDDLERLDALAAAALTETDTPTDPESRRAALAPLLDGVPHGVAYLVGPARAPIGFVILSFGWSLDLGGLEARIDRLFIRRAVRGRGISAEVLAALPAALAEAGLKAMHVEIDSADSESHTMYIRAGFRPAPDRPRLTLKL